MLTKITKKEFRALHNKKEISLLGAKWVAKEQVIPLIEPGKTYPSMPLSRMDIQSDKTAKTTCYKIYNRFYIVETIYLDPSGHNTVVYQDNVGLRWAR